MTAVAAKPRIRVTSQGQLRGAVIDGQLVRTGTPSSAYMRGNQSPFFFNWNPALRDQRDDVRVGYADAAARAIDAMHNSGWIAGAVDQSVASIIGTMLRLAARPDRLALGWTDKQVQDWSQIVERRWSTFAENPIECDAAGKMSMGELSAAALKAYYSHGESLALLPFIRRPFSSPGTKVQLLPPHRLVQDSNLTGLHQGVLSDSYGLATGYRVRLDALNLRTADIRARDGAGRPQVIHLFEGREGQTRGITPLAPVLKVVKQYDQLSDGTLQAALIQALFAATVEGEAPTAEILQGLQSEDEQQGVAGGDIADLAAAQASWYQNTKIDLGGASRVAHMFPGTKLKFNRSEHPNSTYVDFAKFLLREVARCLGMTFETLTGDYTGATYSSVRMAGSEIWPIILRRRTNIAGRFMQIVYEAWLEEQIEQGFIPFPQGLMGFLANRPFVVPADWRGPAKPQADDLKTAKAHEVYKRLGIMSDERICADLGYDWEDEYAQRAREQKMREEMGLPEGDTLVVAEDPLADKLVSEPA